MARGYRAPTFSEWGTAQATIPHSPSVIRYRITHPLRIHRPFGLRINHSFAVSALAHLGTIIRTSLSRTPSEHTPSRSGGPAFLWPVSASRFAWTGAAVPNFALTQFSEVRQKGSKTSSFA
jgi:hypothetical protein